MIFKERVLNETLALKGLGELAVSKLVQAILTSSISCHAVSAGSTPQDLACSATGNVYVHIT